MGKDFSLERIWKAFGNGDCAKGRSLLEELTERIEYARDCHSWGIGKECDSESIAYLSLFGEMEEWYRATFNESRERQHSEALDVLAVAVRIANREYDIPYRSLQI